MNSKAEFSGGQNLRNLEQFSMLKTMFSIYHTLKSFLGLVKGEICITPNTFPSKLLSQGWGLIVDFFFYGNQHSHGQNDTGRMSNISAYNNFRCFIFDFSKFVYLIGKISQPIFKPILNRCAATSLSILLSHLSHLRFIKQLNTQFTHFPQESKHYQIIPKSSFFYK